MLHGKLEGIRCRNVLLPYVGILSYFPLDVKGPELTALKNEVLCPHAEWELCG